MSNDRPMFSIVMPTRNRAHLLRFALRSALNQTFDDYEVVVSDNFSSDDTPDVVRQLGSDRVRYFRTDRVLPMHESWDFALNQALGERVMFLCDDDALLPYAIERIADCFSKHDPGVVAWLTGYYFLDTPCTAFSERRGQLALPRGSRSIIHIDSRSQLLALFAMRSNFHLLPRFLNSCCSRRIVEKVRQDLGRAILPPCPDYTSCAAILAKTEGYAFIDSPLGIMGHGSHVFGVAPGPAAPTCHVQFVEDYSGGMMKHVPLSFLTSENLIAESLLTVREAMPRELSWAQLDWVGYFAGCYVDLLSLIGMGLDISSLRREFRSVLSTYPVSVRARVWQRTVGARLKGICHRPRLWRAIVGSGLLRLLDASIRRRRRTVLGWKCTIPDILEAVRVACEFDAAGSPTS